MTRYLPPKTLLWAEPQESLVFTSTHQHLPLLLLLQPPWLQGRTMLKFKGLHIQHLLRHIFCAFSNFRTVLSLRSCSVPCFISQDDNGTQYGKQVSMKQGE
jgi:hypothetical protein